LFIGHYGLALGSKRLVPTVSLGVLFLACQFADLLWPTLVLLRVERFTIVPGITRASPLDFQYYPYSHSLIALAVWGVLFALAYRIATGSEWRTALILCLLVVSHWMLDFIVHRPDLPLVPGGGPKVGLGLWNSVPGTLIVEYLLFVLGAWIYIGSTAARDRIGSIGLWALLLFLAAVEAANVFGPPPRSVTAVAWSAESMWLLIAWGFWVDHHRTSRGEGALSTA
jgi:hypothetical protein